MAENGFFVQMPGGPSPGQYPSMQFPGNPSFSQTAHLQSQQLRSFWEQQMQEIHEVGADAAEFKNHQLPLARIKKVRFSLRSLLLSLKAGLRIRHDLPSADHEI